MAAAFSEGGGVKVNGGGTTMTKSLRMRTVAACSEAGVETTACSGARDEAVVCYGAGIKDGKWWRRCGDF
jgi:hypothetical protein